jgi:O-acetyl-ADP-ribose deacetylase
MSESVASRMSVVVGDIAALEVDVIVNAANGSLLGGGGVDGAIHGAAGPGLLEECRRLGGCPTGEARITGGHDLRAPHVVHTVGPVYRAADPAMPALLRSCYESSLVLAAGVGATSIAFPCISTGVYGYPKAEACDIAVRAVSEWLMSAELPRAVVFCCFDRENAALYEQALGRLTHANYR